MSGRYNGMPQKIIQVNPHEAYIPCAGHSLNLAGRSSVDCYLETVNLLGITQSNYNLFSTSTHLWFIVLQCLRHAAVVKQVLQCYAAIVDALSSIHDDDTQKGDVRREAEIIKE